MSSFFAMMAELSNLQHQVLDSLALLKQMQYRLDQMDYTIVDNVNVALFVAAAKETPPAAIVYLNQVQHRQQAQQLA